MTPKPEDRNATKLLIAVAAVVVAGAVGLAIVAGLSVEKNEPAETVARTAAPPLQAVPAFGPETVADDTITPASLQKVPGTVDAEIQRAAEELFRVDPSADFVAVGARAYDEGAYAEAAAYFQAEVEARPERAWTQYMLGLARWKSGRADAAVEAMERSAELDPDTIKTRINLSRIQNERGEFDRALEAAEVATGRDEASAEAHFLRGRSLRNLGRIDEAIVALQRSIELDPDNGHARNLLGLTYIGLRLDGEAVEQLRRAAEIVPQLAYVHNNLGMALELAGRRDEAIAAYRIATDLDADHDRSAANLARLGAVAAATGVRIENTETAAAAELEESVAVEKPETVEETGEVANATLVP
jgi:tetratricopeptide (TPR) repeat protein